MSEIPTPAPYPHFMLKEIFEQPAALRKTLDAYVSSPGAPVNMAVGAFFAPGGQPQITFVACGTSWHAALVAEHLFERFAGLSPRVVIASEFVERPFFPGEGAVVIGISQSGETADTLAALRKAKAGGAQVISICNVPESTIATLADLNLMTHAGREIGIASTKAFTAQLSVLYLLAVAAGESREVLSAGARRDATQALDRAAGAIAAYLGQPEIEAPYREISARWASSHAFLVIGRGILAPIAFEGALKIKETSYIPAQAIHSGELRHGPIALVDAAMPSIVLAPEGPSYAAVRKNITDLQDRQGGTILVLSEGDTEGMTLSPHHLIIPAGLPPEVQPLLTAIPMQLLAYHLACARGTPVDNPRALSKAVTT